MPYDRQALIKALTDESAMHNQQRELKDKYPYLQGMIKELSDNSVSRADLGSTPTFTYAGRVAHPGMSLGQILAQRGTVGDMEEGNNNSLFKPFSTKSGDVGKVFIPTNNPLTNQWKNNNSNIFGLMNSANAETREPLGSDIINRFEGMQKNIVSHAKDLYNYLFPYDINVSDFLPK